MPASEPFLIRVAVFAPLRRFFHYLPAPGMAAEQVRTGLRVRVPFGKGQRYGIVLGLDRPASPQAGLKPIGEVLDEAPLLPDSLHALLTFAAQYYHHPVGEVWATALPTLLRKGGAPVPETLAWTLSAAGQEQLATGLKRAPKQRQALAYLREHAAPVAEEHLAQAWGRSWRSLLAHCAERGWIRTAPRQPSTAPVPPPPMTLNSAQAAAVAAIGAVPGFTAHLLDGITGSGKTAVYLEAIAPLLAAGKQALVLVPDISLTPQLLQRFADRFGAARVAALHSGLTDAQRLAVWSQARRGEIAVLVGTRSALFTPLARPGILIVDEEHDASLKQQEGFRYSARDLAVARARFEDIPVVLGSATPSLESLHNVQQGRYRHLTLPQRAGGAALPTVELVDLRRQPLQGGLSAPLLQAVHDTLARGEQVLLFINRRGFAPAILCHECGWVAYCRRCSVPLTLHQGARRLRCHHCGAEQRIPEQCGNALCGSPQLIPVGQGTEQVESALRAQPELANFPVQRIDRDAVRRKGALEAALATVQRGTPQILVGTQMLAKGHHFPDVTLVGIVNADQGLFSNDFRGQERLLAMVVQVAGRAGRAEKPGRVLIQTHHPEHPLMQALRRLDYGGYATILLEERRAAGLPPYTCLALLHAEAHQPGLALHFLQEAAACLHHPALSVHGPFPAPVERRAGRYRAQLWLQAPRRELMAHALGPWMPEVEKLPAARRVRWSLDVDPLDLL
ncbi:MAG: primosomal protein N' [Pseudomonadota bacterium]|uniref:primosomal protein N' n=1 Tax=Thermithiobacillus tepidarius TaxID=929 RepID=UPI00042713C5|nr:primosomal protein N' [Thermithiobacillus tepidarius]